jgi:hypothetical protein
VCERWRERDPGVVVRALASGEVGGGEWWSRQRALVRAASGGVGGGVGSGRGRVRKERQRALVSQIRASEEGARRVVGRGGVKAELVLHVYDGRRSRGRRAHVGSTASRVEVTASGQRRMDSVEGRVTGGRRTRSTNQWSRGRAKRVVCEWWVSRQRASEASSEVGGGRRREAASRRN